MAALSTASVGLSGAAVTFTPATSGGDDCATGAGVVLLVKNDDTASHTVTLVTPGQVNGLAIDDRAITVAASTTTAIPVTGDYRDKTTGRASITYDAVTSVSVAVVRVAA